MITSFLQLHVLVLTCDSELKRAHKWKINILLRYLSNITSINVITQKNGKNDVDESLPNSDSRASASHQNK